MTKSPTRNSSLWLACAGVLLVATAGAVAGPAQALLQGGASTLAARKVLLSDAVFTAGAVLFLEAGLWWGLRWHPAAAPYRGAWLTATGGRELPAGFAAYLPLAGLLAFLLPAAALGYLLASGRAAAGLVLLGGYTAVFFVQMLLETRLFHRNPMSPAIPFTFAPYRFWQLARSLWALRAGAVPSAPAWMPALLIFLLLFWCFDVAVTAVQLPWVFNWQLVGSASKDAS